MLPFEKTQRWIYVLELEKGNIYVGQSDNVEKRLKKHGTKRGAAWTNIYKPIKEILRIDAGLKTESEAMVLENETTIEFMNKYGWQKVRGGDFSSPNEMVIYNNLVASQDKYSYSFELKKPSTVKKEHILEIRRGMNRSNIKLDILKHIDKKQRAVLLASISGTFNTLTALKKIEELQELEMGSICEQWFQKNKNRFDLTQISYDDILSQFEKLQADKIKRLSK